MGGGWEKMQVLLSERKAKIYANFAGNFPLGLGVLCPSWRSLFILGAAYISSHGALSHCFNKWRRSGGGSNKTMIRI